jgi:hypothetical protein
MATKFNGTQVSLGATALNPTSVTVSSGASAANVSTTVSTEHKMISGLSEHSIECDVKGCPAQAHGATGALTVAWTDGGTVGTLAACVVTRVTCRGRLDGPIEGSVRFRKARA